MKTSSEKSERIRYESERYCLKNLCAGGRGERARERERSLERAFLSGHSNKDKD